MDLTAVQDPDEKPDASDYILSLTDKEGDDHEGHESSCWVLTQICTVLRFLYTLILVSRPGFYCITFGMFVIPLAIDPSGIIRRAHVVWWGLAFSVLPMNLLVYSMNDLADVDIDSTNPRKGGCFGAKATARELQLCLTIAVVCVVSFPPLLTGDVTWSLMWSATGIFCNWLYNFGPRCSRVPFLDLLPPFGYLLTIPFSAKVTQVPNTLSWWFLGFLGLFTVRMQLWFERIDLHADLAVGKITTAGFFGDLPTAFIMFQIMIGELACASMFGCTALQGWVVFSGILLALDMWLRRYDVTIRIFYVAGFVFLVPAGMCFDGFAFIANKLMAQR